MLKNSLKADANVVRVQLHRKWKNRAKRPGSGTVSVASVSVNLTLFLTDFPLFFVGVILFFNTPGLTVCTSLGNSLPCLSTSLSFTAFMSILQSPEFLLTTFFIAGFSFTFKGRILAVSLSFTESFSSVLKMFVNRSTELHLFSFYLCDRNKYCTFAEHTSAAHMFTTSSHENCDCASRPLGLRSKLNFKTTQNFKSAQITRLIRL